MERMTRTNPFPLQRFPLLVTASRREVSLSTESLDNET